MIKNLNQNINKPGLQFHSDKKKEKTVGILVSGSGFNIFQGDV